jgi:hypothetical protein
MSSSLLSILEQFNNYQQDSVTIPVQPFVPENIEGEDELSTVNQITYEFGDDPIDQFSDDDFQTNIYNPLVQGLETTTSNINYTFSNNPVYNLSALGEGLAIESGLTENTSISGEDFTEFFIKYQKDGKPKIFQFAIAPALESYTGGGGQTPEIKPGLLNRTTMAIKTFVVAGGEPIYQILGKEPTLFQLNGLFIGAETNSESEPSSKTSSLTSNAYSLTASLSAVDIAEIFDRDVAKSGRLIEVHLYSKTAGTDKEIKIKYQCLLQNARYFIRRTDRVYYALDLYLLKRL